MSEESELNNLAMDGSMCESEEDSSDHPPLTTLLTPEMLTELGPVDLYWFEHSQPTSPEVRPSNRLSCQTTQISTSTSKNDSPWIYSECRLDTSIDPISEMCRDAADHPSFSPLTQAFPRYPFSPSDQLLTLGASMGGHDLSWTSSLVTPTSKPLSGMRNTGCSPEFAPDQSFNHSRSCFSADSSKISIVKNVLLENFVDDVGCSPGQVSWCSGGRCESEEKWLIATHTRVEKHGSVRLPRLQSPSAKTLQMPVAQRRVKRKSLDSTPLLPDVSASQTSEIHTTPKRGQQLDSECSMRETPRAPSRRRWEVTRRSLAGWSEALNWQSSDREFSPSQLIHATATVTSDGQPIHSLQKSAREQPVDKGASEQIFDDCTTPSNRAGSLETTIRIFDSCDNPKVNSLSPANIISAECRSRSPSSGRKFELCGDLSFDAKRRLRSQVSENTERLKQLLQPTVISNFLLSPTQAVIKMADSPSTGITLAATIPSTDERPVVEVAITAGEGLEKSPRGAEHFESCQKVAMAGCSNVDNLDYGYTEDFNVSEVFAIAEETYVCTKLLENDEPFHENNFEGGRNRFISSRSPAEPPCSENSSGLNGRFMTDDNLQSTSAEKGLNSQRREGNDVPNSSQKLMMLTSNFNDSQESRWCQDGDEEVTRANVSYLKDDHTKLICDTLPLASKEVCLTTTSLEGVHENTKTLSVSRLCFGACVPTSVDVDSGVFATNDCRCSGIVKEKNVICPEGPLTNHTVMEDKEEWELHIYDEDSEPDIIQSTFTPGWDSKRDASRCSLLYKSGFGFENMQDSSEPATADLSLIKETVTGKQSSVVEAGVSIECVPKPGTDVEHVNVFPVEVADCVTDCNVSAKSKQFPVLSVGAGGVNDPHVEIFDHSDAIDCEIAAERDKTTVHELLNESENHLEVNGVTPLAGSHRFSFCEGFQTANGNPIIVNEESVRKRTALLMDLSNLPAIPAEKLQADLCREPFSVLCATSSGSSVMAGMECRRPIPQNEQTWNSERNRGSDGTNLLSDTDGTHFKSKILNTCVCPPQSFKPTVAPVSNSTTTGDTFGGISTTSSKRVNFSREHLEAVKAKFEEDSRKGASEESIEYDRGNRSVSCVMINAAPRIAMPPGLGGFTTANDKSVKVFKAHLDKAKAKFEEESQELNGECLGGSSTIPTKSMVAPKNLGGFNTASGKAIMFSEEHMVKARAKFEEESLILTSRRSSEVENVFEMRCAVSDESSETLRAMVPPLGFSTASGKTVRFSKEHLQQAKALFADESLTVMTGEPTDSKICDHSSIANTQIMPNDATLSPTAHQKFGRMSTNHVGGGDCDGIGKKINLFGGRSTPVTIRSNGATNQLKNTAFKPPKRIECGFTLASGKKATVSDNALREARQKLADESATDVPKASAMTTSSPKTGETFVTNLNSVSVNIEPPAKNDSVSYIDDEAWEDFPQEFLATLIEFKLDRSKPAEEIRDSDKENGHCKSPRSAPVKSIYLNNGEGEFSKIPLLESSVNERRHLSVNTVGLSTSATSMQEQPSFAHSYEVLESTRAFIEDESTSNYESSWLSPLVVRNAGIPRRTCVNPQQVVPSISFVSNASTNEVSTGSLKRPMDSVNEAFPRKRLSIQENSYLSDVITSTTRAQPQYLEHWNELPTDVLRRRKMATSEQLSRITIKRDKLIARKDGTLWTARLSKNRIPISSFVNGRVPCRMADNVAIKRGVKQSTLAINSHNAEEYRFKLEEHYEHVDGICDAVIVENCSELIFDERNRAGKDEFYRSLLDTDGVDPRLVTQQWAYNHYRWIVWKLAATEVSFPTEFGGLLLTPNTVAKQLHYRYNVEIDYSRRSALRKIVERDDSSQKTMCLCVARVLNIGGGIAAACSTDSAPPNSDVSVLELTDGWYGLKTILDVPLTDLVLSGRIRCGMKLLVHGAELFGSTEACAPLDAPSSLFLRINANCCRPARWDAKLGYHSAAQPFALPLNSLNARGGLVGRVDVVVMRVYPMQYLEKLADGSCRVFNERTNDDEENRYQHQRSDFLDRVMSQVQRSVDKEMIEKGAARKYTRGAIKNLTTGEEIALALESFGDPSIIEETLTSEQKRALITYKLDLTERKQAMMRVKLQQALDQDTGKGGPPPKRVVSPFLKIRAVGLSSKDLYAKATCQITVWTPPEDLQAILEEGKAYQIYYLLAENRGLRSQRDILLKSIRKTRFQPLAQPYDPTPFLHYHRAFTSLADISSPDFRPPFEEVDVMAVVVKVDSATFGESSGRVVNVYVADGDRNVIVIKFWNGLESFGLQNVVKTSSALAITNLQWRNHVVGQFPLLYATEHSRFSAKPVAMEALIGSIPDIRLFVDDVTAKVSNSPSVVKQTWPVGGATPGRNALGQPVSTSTPNNNPLSGRKPFCEGASSSSLPSPMVEEASPSTPIFVNQLQKLKMDRLQCYASPPPLTPVFAPVSRLIRSKFRDPRKLILPGCTETPTPD